MTGLPASRTRSGQVKKDAAWPRVIRRGTNCKGNCNDVAGGLSHETATSARVKERRGSPMVVVEGNGQPGEAAQGREAADQRRGRRAAHVNQRPSYPKLCRRA